ncbi:hypothetical protein NLG42_16430 [Flavobacterium plurextorum]|uniref:hypothetical protein n=1 Tax=Flavobacterium TaxID=237 RepID=UPI00214D3A89|nr:MULTISPECIES: hypothetical protein [Flavobacterium]UUW07682.1 hypothetical protein NLG42_16430 [Flavobacterium plurextorum]
MSRKLLSEKEYDVLHKLLIDQMTPGQAAQQFGSPPQYAQELNQSSCDKEKRAAELTLEIDQYIVKLRELKREIKANASPAKDKKDKKEKDRQKLISNSLFPFSRRMNSTFGVLDVSSFGELADIPLRQFQCYRGFKIQSKKELVAFIEFENIAYLFKGFSRWKKQPIEQLK